MGPGIFLGCAGKEKQLKQLLLIRHCESSHAQERYIGRTDSFLTQAGVVQARKLAKRLEGLACAHVVSSPSLRALETAKLATQGTGLAIEQDADLREIDFGRWEGMSFREISVKDPELVERWVLGRMDFCFPEGDSLEAFSERVSRAGYQMRKRPEDTLVVVTHGGVIRFLLCHFLRIDPRSHLMFEVSPGSITNVHFHDGEAVLSGLNDRCHLEEF